MKATRTKPEFLAFSLAVSLFASPSSVAADVTLPRSAPETQGVSSAGIRAFVETADQRVIAMHSFMLVRHGHVVAEGWWKPEAADKPHVLHSLSKSFTSTAVGLAVAEGKLSVDDPVLKFFPEDAPAEPSDKLKAMRVRDLLTMTTGHGTEAKFTTNAPWAQTFLEHPVLHKPGTHFLYNTPGSHMLSAIVRKVTGETVLDYLKPRLFEPLGIANPEWGSSPQGNTFGGWGLKIRTEDIARFGQLYLQKGKWNGKQLVPASWVEQATAKQVSNGSDPAKDWDQGYGFQFWRCRHGAYRGDGANGQFCIVLPEQDAVIAITADTRDMQAELNVVWEKLLPAFHPKRLPPDRQEHRKLLQTLANLSVRAPTNTAPSASNKALEDQPFANSGFAAQKSAGIIGLSVLTMNNPFFKEIADSMTAEAAKSGYSVAAVSGDFDVARQQNQVKDFIVKKVSAIFLCPCDSTAIGPAIREANKAGIPVFTADIASLDTTAKVVAHIATDNLQGGRMAAEAVVEAIGGQGKVAILDHPEVESVLLRTRGFEEKLAELNKQTGVNVKVVARLPGGGDKAKSFKAAQDLIQAHPDLNAIFAVNDPSALGARAALENAGKADQIRIVGFDGQPEGKQAIKDGKLYADPIQFPDKIGAEAVRAFIKYMNGEDVPKQVLIPTALYRKADAAKDSSLK